MSTTGLRALRPPLRKRLAPTSRPAPHNRHPSRPPRRTCPLRPDRAARAARAAKVEPFCGSGAAMLLCVVVDYRFSSRGPAAVLAALGLTALLLTGSACHYPKPPAAWTGAPPL